jgi:predicted Rossmann fold flavoprotein
MNSHVVVIGAGAAGIIAAWRATSLGATVTLLEKTSRIGTKILISGGGKCNITHDGPIEEVLREFRPYEARFIRPACYRFTNADIVEMLTSRGLNVYTRPDGRIFPVDQSAKDVVRILATYLGGVDLRLSTPVQGISQGFVQTSSESLECDRIVIASGGSSYPNSGTTGDGWSWCRALGHTIVKPIAALAPIYLHMDEATSSRSGIALRDCILRARQHGREFVRWRDDLLFTHHGISGPTALGISRNVTEQMAEGTVELEIDILPEESFEALSARLLAYASENPKRQVKSWVEDQTVERLAPYLLEAANVDGTTILTQLDKKSRNRVVNSLKAFPLGPVRTVPLERGEVVAGGVSLDEVDAHTMASKVVPNLFLCGEVLDIAGPVGGYNLQAAFATGYVAGESAAS